MDNYTNNKTKLECTVLCRDCFYSTYHLCDICVQTSIQGVMDYSTEQIQLWSECNLCTHMILVSKLCRSLEKHWLRRWMETGPPPSLPLIKSAERVPTPPPSQSRPIISTVHLCVRKVWAAPGELRGNSPLFVVTSMSQNKEIMGLLCRNNGCLLTKWS